MTTSALNRFAELSEEKTELQGELNKVKAELKGLKDQVVNYFIDAGQKSITLDNGRSIRIQRQLWAGLAEDVSGQQAAETLAADPDWAAFATCNWSSLSSEVRDLPRDADGMPILPDAIKGVIKVTERVEPRSRKAS